MKLRVFHIVWLALLAGVPAFLGGNPSGNLFVDFASELAYSPFYWASAFCGIAIMLLPDSVFSRIIQGSRHEKGVRVMRMVGFSAALICFAICIILPVYMWQKGPTEYSPAVFKLVLIASLFWTVMTFVSMMFAVASLRVDDLVASSSDRAPIWASCFSFASASVLVGIARPMLMKLCMPECSGLLPLERPSVALLLLPGFIFALLWFVALRLGGRKGLSTSFGGFLYGEVLGHVVLRMSPLLYQFLADRPVLVFAGCMIAFGLAAFYSNSISKKVSIQEGAGEASESCEPIVLDEAWGLSAREGEAVLHAVDGLSSREAAVLMGVQPSTVRNLQRRAWSKMGVSSVAEARDLVASIQSQDRRCEEPDASDKAEGRILLGIGAVAVLLGMCPWIKDAGTWFMPLTTSAAAGVGVVGSILLWSHTFPARELSQRGNLLKGALLVCCALAEVLSQMLAPDVFPAIVLMSSWALGSFLMEYDSAGDFATPLSVVLLFLGFFGGVSLFVIWKGATWPYIAPVDQFLMPIGANLACSVVALSMMGRRRLAAGFGLICFSASVLTVLYDAYTLVYVFWLLSVGYAVRCEHLHGVQQLTRSPFLGFGMGLMFGTGVLSRMFDALNLQGVVYGTESALRLHLVANYGMGVSVAVCIVAGVTLWVVVVSDYGRCEVAQRFESLPGQRIKSALQARGLSDLEVEIMMQTFSGKTCASIAESVCYSMSTVYAMRHDVYRKMGARGAEQTLEAIVEIAGI